MLGPFCVAPYYQCRIRHWLIAHRSNLQSCTFDISLTTFTLLPGRFIHGSRRLHRQDGCGTSVYTACVYYNFTDIMCILFSVYRASLGMWLATVFLVWAIINFPSALTSAPCLSRIPYPQSMYMLVLCGYWWQSLSSGMPIRGFCLNSDNVGESGFMRDENVHNINYILTWTQWGCQVKMCWKI